MIGRLKSVIISKGRYDSLNYSLTRAEKIAVMAIPSVANAVHLDEWLNLTKYTKLTGEGKGKYIV